MIECIAKHFQAHIDREDQLNFNGQQQLNLILIGHQHKYHLNLCLSNTLSGKTKRFADTFSARHFSLENTRPLHPEHTLTKTDTHTLTRTHTHTHAQKHTRAMREESSAETVTETAYSEESKSK